MSGLTANRSSHQNRRANSPRIDVIGLDGDDTLWYSEALYVAALNEFKHILREQHPPQLIERELYETETRNLQYYGYGVKGYALSMIECALKLTKYPIPNEEMQRVIDMAKLMLSAPVQLLDHVEETVAVLSQRYRLMLITKGDLLHQENKVARSGLNSYFTCVEIVSEKNKTILEAILKKHRINPCRFMMVGDSLRSDILPALAVGATAVYIPHKLSWAHENADTPEDGGSKEYYELERIDRLPWLAKKLTDRRSRLKVTVDDKSRPVTEPYPAHSRGRSQAFKQQQNVYTRCPDRSRLEDSETVVISHTPSPSHDE